MSTDVCLRDLATPASNADLYDLLGSCTTQRRAAPRGLRSFVAPVLPVRLPVRRSMSRRASVGALASMSFLVDPRGRRAEEEFLFLDLP